LVSLALLLLEIKKAHYNKRYRGQGPSYFKIGEKIKYDLDDVRRMENESYIETG